MLLSGTLLTPTGQPMRLSVIKLVARETSLDVLMSVGAEFKTDSEGGYEVDCPIGRYQVVVYTGSSYGLIGGITINSDTTPTSINELLILEQTAIPDNPILVEIQQAVSDAEAAAESAEQSAASIGADNLSGWANSQTFQLVSATRDSNSAIITASIVWPDGIPGLFTTDVASVDFPGAIDAWHATYVGSPAKLITQTAVTRDANGAVIAQPAITIS